MSAWAAALASLGALCALSGCFEVNYGNCRITCTTQEGYGCPAGLTCLIESGATGLCAPPGTKTCPTGSNTDAAPDRPDAREAGTDARDAGPDAEAGASLPPPTLCHNGSCLTLPDSIRKNLVLLLWPSNLPPVGSPVSVWQDQSGQGNDAHALYPSAPPHVIPSGVQLDQTQPGTGFVVGNSPSLDFGAGDFAIIVVGGLSSTTARVSFFRKSDGARTNIHQISIDWVVPPSLVGAPQGAVNDTVVSTDAIISQPSVGAYTLQRAADHLELHLNGTVLASSDLSTPGASTTSAADVFVGVGSLSGEPAASVEAVMAIRASPDSVDLKMVERFLRSVFATAP